MEFSSPEANARFSPYSPELCCSFLSFSNSFAHFSESEASVADHFKGGAPCSARNLLWESRHSFWNLFGMIALIVYELLLKSPEKNKKHQQQKSKIKSDSINMNHLSPTGVNWRISVIWHSLTTKGDRGLGPVSRKSRNVSHFVWHNSLCILKTKASRGTKRCGYFYFYFYFLHNMQQ